jgi:predicted membrane chloride channel (bestrophin family)
MPGIIVLALVAITVAIVALIVLSFAVHLLFSPWLLVAIAILAWIKFRPRRSRP